MLLRGIPLCLAGDIRQTLPITKGNTLADAIRNDIRRDPDWIRHLKVFQLHEPMRNRRDPEYAASIDNIGNGVGEGPLPVDARADEHHVYVPPGVRVIDGFDEVAMQTLRDLVHPHLHRGAAYTKEAARRVICAPHNATVLEHNLACTYFSAFSQTMPSTLPLPTSTGLDKVPGDIVSLHGTHQLEEQAASSEDFLSMSEEHLRTVNKSGTPPAVLQVKDYCLLMCTRNRE